MTYRQFLNRFFLNRWILLFALALGSSAARAATCCTFPTVEKPTASYLESPRKFGAGRANGRAHAAADLYQSRPGQGVRAVDDGVVLRGKYYFYQGTYALEVKHAPGFVARYGEITGRNVPGLTNGASVKRGALLGFVGQVNSGCCEPMLHFEKYSGTLKGALTQPQHRPFQRRLDLVNPTSALLKWERATFPPIALPVTLLGTPSLPATSNETILMNQNSFQPLIQILRNWGLGELSDETLAAALRDLKLRPTIERDENPETGVLSIVQTEVEDLGGQHVHAQFFGDDVNNLSLQHISFETQANATTMAEVTQALVNSFPLLGTPEVQSADFTRWRLPNDKILWIKNLGQEELLENPFYLYNVKDLGILRIGIEQDPE